MTKKITFETSPEVCSNAIEVAVKDGIIQEVKIIGGCPGSAIGLARLVAGLPATEAIQRLTGIRCGGKSTSCPDQLAQAIQKIIHSNH